MRMTAAALALALILPLSATPASAAGVCGDMDGDGEITNHDGFGIWWILRKMQAGVDLPSWLDGDANGIADGCEIAGPELSCGAGTMPAPDGSTCVVDPDSDAVIDLLSAAYDTGFEDALGVCCDPASDLCGPVCNNGDVETGEQCDDGANEPGDGCSAECQVETGWGCAEDASAACVQCPGDGTCFGHGVCDDGVGGSGTCDCADGFDPATGCESCLPGFAGPDCAPFAVDTTIAFSEVRVDQPGADNDEYVELSGTPGSSLIGLTLVVLGDSSSLPGESGIIESITDLSGLSVPASGLVLVAEDTFTLATADATLDLSFENSDNITLLLVSNFTGENGQNLDVDNDGVLDVTPWDAIIDVVALIEEDNPPVATELHYGPPTAGPDGTFAPGHVYLCGDTWMVGAFDPADALAADTPGALNPCDLACPGDGTCSGHGACDSQTGTCVCDGNFDPATDCADCLAGFTGPACSEVIADDFVLLNEIRTDQPGGDIDEYIELMGTPGMDLTGLSILVLGDSGSSTGVIETLVPLDGMSITASGLLVLAEDTFTLGTADVVTDLSLENSDNLTFILVGGFSGLLGDGLDADADGILDSEPWTTELDRIALVEEANPPLSTEYHYGPPMVGPDGDFAPGHIFRCGDDWFVGPYDPADAGALDTPGDLNACAG